MPAIDGSNQMDEVVNWKIKDLKTASEKRDFENLDVRLYLALKNVIKAMGDRGVMRPSESKLGIAEQNALKIIKDFEDSFGPIPEWAIACNFGLELMEGAQLYTLDGRHHGNGWIVDISEECSKELMTRDNPYGVYTVFNVITDAGTPVRKLSEIELLRGWAIGEWICTRERILTRFDRDNHFEV